MSRKKRDEYYVQIDFGDYQKGYLFKDKEFIALEYEIPCMGGPFRVYCRVTAELIEDKAFHTLLAALEPKIVRKLTVDEKKFIYETCC
jgi:hypothetical protein